MKKRRIVLFSAVIFFVFIFADILVHGEVKGGVVPEIEIEPVVALVNEKRQHVGVTQVQSDAVLMAAAQQKASLMAANGEFAHTLADGTTSWKLLQDAGYRYQYAGENLAVHFVTDAAVVDAWMASPSHQKTMLNGVYTDIGVGVASGVFEGYEGTFVVLLLATPFVL